MVSDILNGLLVVTMKDHEVVDFGLFWYETAVPDILQQWSTARGRHLLNASLTVVIQYLFSTNIKVLL